MSSRPSDSEIDRLYQLPLAQFTAARQALAKRTQGTDRARIQSLPKPTFPAWAANQLYWKDRSAIDRIVKAREALRRGQEEALRGRRVDVRSAGVAYRSAVNDALEALRDLVGPQALTPEKKQQVRQLLEALPPDAGLGRLARPPPSLGFEVFSGIPANALRARSLPSRGPSAPRRERPARAVTQVEDARAQEAATERRKKALAEARGRVQLAQRHFTRMEASETRAALKLDQERSREGRAREVHEQALKRLTRAQAHSEGLRKAKEAAAEALREAQEELDRTKE